MMNLTIQFFHSKELKQFFVYVCRPWRLNSTVLSKISEAIEITSWLVSAYDFYSRVVKDR